MHATWPRSRNSDPGGYSSTKVVVAPQPWLEYPFLARSLRELIPYRKNFYDSPSQEEVGESRLGRKSRGSETKFLEMD